MEEQVDVTIARPQCDGRTLSWSIHVSRGLRDDNPRLEAQIEYKVSAPGAYAESQLN